MRFLTVLELVMLAPSMKWLSFIVGCIIVTMFATTSVITVLALIKKVKMAPAFLKLLFVKLILQIILAAFFIFYTTIPTPSRYCGIWKGVIQWEPEYAAAIFNYDGKEDIQLINPRSEGELHIYRFKGLYMGYAKWETINGQQVYSKLAVALTDFNLGEKGNLISFGVHILVREKQRPFSYAPFQIYSIGIDQTNDRQLIGKMRVHRNGEVEDVGTIVMDRMIIPDD